MAQKVSIFKIAYPIVLFVCFFGLQEAWLPIAAFFTDLEVVTSRRIDTVVGYLFWALTLVVAMLMFDYFFGFPVARVEIYEDRPYFHGF